MKVTVVFLILSCIALSQSYVVSNESVGDTCSICTEIAKTLKEEIEKGLDTLDVDEAAKNVCDIVFVIPEGICKPVVEKLLKDVIEKLDKEDPQDLCKAIELC